MPRALALAVLLASMASALSPVGVSAGTPQTAYGVNLLRNPKAEAPQHGSSLVPQWEEISRFRQVRYGAAGGFPTLAEGKRIHGGHKFFAGGTYYLGCDLMFQPVAIVKRATAVDSGHVEADISAWMATFGHDTDRAVLSLYFDDMQGSLLTSVRLSAQATSDRFVHQTAHVGVPWHARRMYVELTTEDAEGTYCDSYFDNLSLVIRRVD